MAETASCPTAHPPPDLTQFRAVQVRWDLLRSCELGTKSGTKSTRPSASNSTATGRWGSVAKMPDVPGKRDGERLNRF